MRAIALAVIVVALSAAPDALAGLGAIPPTTVAAMRDGDQTLLSWTPAPGAVRYVVTGGDDIAAMGPVGEVTSPSFYAEQSSQFTFYGISTQDPHGHLSPPHIIAIRGDCVATSTSLQMSVSIQGCMNLIP